MVVEKNSHIILIKAKYLLECSQIWPNLESKWVKMATFVSGGVNKISFLNSAHFIYRKWFSKQLHQEF